MTQEPELSPGMTAQDWFQEGYGDGLSGLAFELGPHNQSAAVIEQWGSGWHAGVLESCDVIEDEQQP